eukprot:CAMPEP_0174295960 /NCGR_PEP_ID=MMETSP0809-20121228/46392_1 /TAXON_ID=73025 ORGANISM="Eutreptiella gymnastica-like, Strain CCMP1594" /NCGR_SAMPLE_ID=MMETSP0809 /ASSEMBLY_ACC=CAM_ASM_000658 /LENGTH=62 /DNA_ID=CAMNT_0015398637 /DNA_START=93 /DNA_END=281 /DNA_ORIENTATION=+
MGCESAGVDLTPGLAGVGALGLWPQAATYAATHIPAGAPGRRILPGAGGRCMHDTISTSAQD